MQRLLSLKAAAGMSCGAATALYPAHGAAQTKKCATITAAHVATLILHEPGRERLRGPRNQVRGEAGLLPCLAPGFAPADGFADLTLAARTACERALLPWLARTVLPPA